MGCGHIWLSRRGQRIRDPQSGARPVGSLGLDGALPSCLPHAPVAYVVFPGVRKTGRRPTPGLGCRVLAPRCRENALTTRTESPSIFMMPALDQHCARLWRHRSKEIAFSVEEVMLAEPKGCHHLPPVAELPPISEGSQGGVTLQRALFREVCRLPRFCLENTRGSRTE